MTGFGKSRHIRKNSDFLKAYGGGKRTNHPAMTLVARPRPAVQAPSRLGLSVSRKVGNAVVRNRLRRRLREIFRVSPLKPGQDLVMVARPPAAGLHFAALKDVFDGLCARAGLWQDS